MSSSLSEPGEQSKPQLLDQIRQQLMWLRCQVKSVASIHDQSPLSRSLDAHQAGISK